ncbi:MAG: ABC transporter permease [bacterium]|nr:MAG: ABC transporter permease [bacterium]
MTRLISSLIRALNNLRQSWVVSTITTGIIALSLFLVGGYLLLTHNLDRVIDRWRTEVRITIYVRDGADLADIHALQDSLASFPEVESVTFVTKDQALEEFRAMLQEEDDLLDGLEEHPIPASLRLTPQTSFRSAEGIYAILSRIGDDPIIEEITYGQDWIQRLERAVSALNLGAAILGGILSLAAIFIISNTIKLTVMARKDELEIMRMVGATEWFIRTPFLIEGLIQGAAGSLVSIALLIFAFRFMSSQLDPAFFQALGMASVDFLPTGTIAGILIGGMLLGGLGSLASVGRFSR